MAYKTFSVFKDPDSIHPYSIDWSAELASGETIVTSTWTVDASFTQPAASSISGSLTYVWLGAGTEGRVLRAENHIVTSAGEEENGVINLTMQADY